MSPSPKKPTARECLQPSKLHPTQLELMGDDVDLANLYLALNHHNINIIDAVTDVNVTRTVQGASTVVVEVLDRDRVLLRSGRLSARNDIEIDGLFFRLVAVGKNGDVLNLTFEDREVSLLRTYTKPIKQALSTSRMRLTRAQFVLRLLLEVKEEERIRYFIPELNKVQPIDGYSQLPSANTRIADRTYGIPQGNDLTVKGQPMDEEQRRNANAILDTGVSYLAPLSSNLVRKMLVMSIMCVIQESTLRNLPGGDLDSVGLFQQRASQGWPASRDIPTDATAFFDALKAQVTAHPDWQYWALIQAVQRSAFPTDYAQWRTEAERVVNAYGYVDGTSAAFNNQWETVGDAATNGDYEFYRGLPPTSRIRKQKYGSNWGPESSWDCIQRLASEVNWRAFFVSGVFYFISEDDLIKSQPVAILDEDSPGIISIDNGSYDEGKKTASIQIQCFASRWAAPPGSVIQLKSMGPWNGRWLVNDISRSLFNPIATINLKKRTPRLPEPSGTNLITQQQQTTWGGTPVPSEPGGKQFSAVGPIVQPVPRGFNNDIIQGVHQTAGLPGYPAADFGADAGAPVVAVEDGVIVKLSGHDPVEGPVDTRMGVHGPFGWSIYLLGDSGSTYYYTHLDQRTVQLNQRVGIGQQMAVVADYAKYGGANHTHVGVSPGSKGRPDINDLMSAPLAWAAGKVLQ